LKNLSDEDAALLADSWAFWARPEQLPPEGDWRIWLFLAGRGAGKTRAGAEWVADGVARHCFRRIGLVGASHADTRAVMVEGESGLLAASPAARFEPANRRVLWPAGQVAHLVSADEPDAVRGFQFDAVWADEFCKWPAPQAALDMVLMALRLGKRPRMCLTTTPRAIEPLKDLLALADVAVTRCGTSANAGNLAPGFLAGLELRYGGTRLGRQELDGELIEDNEAALWKRDWIERSRVRRAPELLRLVVAIDPPAAIGRDECGIVAAGLSGEGEAFVLADASAAGLSPAAWAARAARVYETFSADRIVAEANQGGEMVKQVLIDAAPNLPVKLVHASRDKQTRAAPAAALYEQGRVHHAGTFPELEDQMCTFDGTGKSPDRMDALVWALAALFPLDRAVPRARLA
jgi:phage terminase large subunit-like protein